MPVKETEVGGKTEDHDVLEAEKETVQERQVLGVESCRGTKENEDGRVASLSAWRVLGVLSQTAGLEASSEGLKSEWGQQGAAPCK